MEENNTTVSAVDASVESLKKLIATVQEDSELKKGLEDTLRKLTGKENETADTVESAETEQTEGDDTSKNDADQTSKACSDVEYDTDFSDAFSEDAIAGMVVGLVAGAALVGGGVLLHKVLSK